MLRFFNSNDIRMEGYDRIRSQKGLGGSHGRAERMLSGVGCGDNQRERVENHFGWA